MTDADLEVVPRINTATEAGNQYSRDPTVWRYMDLLSVLAMLHKGQLHFTNLKDLQSFDIHEGTGGLSIEILRRPLPPSICVIPETEESKQRNREEIEKLTGELSRPLHERLPEIRARVAKWDEQNRNVHISCWHLNDIESDFMWRVYAKQEFGLAMVSSAQSLVRALAIEGVTPEKIGYGGVTYPSRDELLRYSLEPHFGSASAFMVKHPEFSPEREFRVFVKTKQQAGSCNLRVDLKAMIRGIRMSPLMPEWAQQAVLETLNPICEAKGLPRVVVDKINLRGG